MEMTAQERRLSLGAVMLHMLGIGLTLGLTFPLTSLTLEAWGSAAWVVGLAGAMAPLAILLFMPVLPSVAQRLGAVRAMMLGCGIGIAGLVVMYLVPSASGAPTAAAVPSKATPIVPADPQDVPVNDDISAVARNAVSAR